MRQAQVRRIRQDEVSELRRLAAQDDHEVLAPTHVVVKNGCIVGYLSIGAIPTVNVWMSTEHTEARDSIAVLGQLDAIVDHGGIPMYFMPCDEKSPFFKVMDKLGFRKLFKQVLHYKSFTGD